MNSPQESQSLEAKTNGGHVDINNLTIFETRQCVSRWIWCSKKLLHLMHLCSQLKMHKLSSFHNLRSNQLPHSNTSTHHNRHICPLQIIAKESSPAQRRLSSSPNSPPHLTNNAKSNKKPKPQPISSPQNSNKTKNKPYLSRIGSHKTNPSLIGPLRLNKALASAGVASRRHADDLIFSGRISINGQTVKEPGTRIDITKDKLCMDGKPISLAAASKMYYFALNKPKGHVCSSQGDGSGGSGDRLVVDLFDDWLQGWKARHPGSTNMPRLFTVGRLDMQSVGLLFVTNDGDWAHAVQHPSSGLTKEYVVGLNDRPNKRQLETMQEGCDMDGIHVRPVQVYIDETDAAKRNRIKVVVAEGRNREVRRLIENAGLDVVSLRRVRIGGFRLPRYLKFGEFVELKPHEVRRVLNVGADRSL